MFGLRFVNGMISIGIPGVGGLEGCWQPDERERDAAWELYVELVTRIALQGLKPGQGLLREALSSLHSIFLKTRKILRNYGPTVGRPKSGSVTSVGHVAIAVLNYVLRPVLSTWHPLLLDYENRRPESMSSVEYEAAWERAAELRSVLNDVREELMEYSNVLAEVANVHPPQLDANLQALSSDR